MFRKVVESMEKATVKAALREGKLVCPDCGAKAGKLPAEWGQVMKCGVCGTSASLPEWVAKAGIVRGRADLPPAATKIRKEGDGLGGTVWHIPAGGKYGFFLFFAAFWLGITVLFSGGVFMAILSGGGIEGNVPGWVLVPFFGLFYAIGLGVLYAGLRQKFMRHRLTVSGGGVTLRSEMFGRAKEKSLQSGTVKSIAQKEFYQQNYTPVYGIEIRGSGGKLRFGSALAEADKAWLVADVQEALFGRGEEELKMAVPGHASAGRKEIFSIAIPGPQKHAWIGGLAFSLISIAFVGIGIFVLGDDPLPEKEEGDPWFSGLFSNVFQGIWLIMSSIFTCLGIYTLVTTLRGMGQDRRIEGNSAEISFRTYQRGLVVKDRSFPRSAVTDMRATMFGSSNGKPMKRIELIVGDRSEKLSSWMDGDAADELVAEVRAVL